MTGRSTAWRLVLCWVWSLTALAACAQDESPTADAEFPAATVELPEVVVEGTLTKPGWAPAVTTATRSTVPLKEVPQSIQVLPRQLIEEQAAQNLADTLVNVSGVVPVKPWQSLILSPLVRGFPAEVFTDGMPGYSSASATDPATLINVQSVEVIKGPTAALFGGGVGSPLGGIINSVSVNPEAERKITAGLRTGSWQTSNPFADINLPLAGDGALALRLTADYESAESHIDEVHHRRWSVNPTLHWKISPETELTLRAQFSAMSMLEYAGLPAALALAPATSRVAPYRGPAIDPWRFTGAVDAPLSELSNQRVMASLKHAVSDNLDLHLTAQYFHNRFDEYSIYTFATAQSPLPSEPSRYPVLSGYLPSEVTQFTVNGWINHRFELGPTKHELIAGADLDFTENTAALGFSHYRIDLPPPWPPTILAARSGFIDFAVPGSTLPYVQPPIVDRTQNDFRTAGFYVQDQITAFDRLHVLAGLRAILLSVDHDYRTENTLGAPSRYDESYTEFAPRLGAVLDLAHGLSVFGAYSEGYRGVLNYTGSEPPVPETSSMLEGGFKFSNDDLGLSGSLAAYQLVRSNVPTANPFIPGSTQQIGEQCAQGVEADFAWEPTPAFSVLLTYAFTDARVTEDVVSDIVTDGQQLDRVGKRLPRVPKHSGRIAARYRVQNGKLKGLGFGAGVTMGSKRPVSLTNNYFTRPCCVADAQVSWERNDFKAVLAVTNLTNSFYYEPYPFLGEDVVAPARPISFSLTLSYVF